MGDSGNIVAAARLELASLERRLSRIYHRVGHRAGLAQLTHGIGTVQVALEAALDDCDDLLSGARR